MIRDGSTHVGHPSYVVASTPAQAVEVAVNGTALLTSGSASLPGLRRLNPALDLVPFIPVPMQLFIFLIHHRQGLRAALFASPISICHEDVVRHRRRCRETRCVEQPGLEMPHNPNSPALLGSADSLYQIPLHPPCPPFSTVMLPSDTDRTITIKEVSFISNLIDVGVAALIVYDYLLTVRRESLLFWTRRVNAASILFFTNRYFALLYYVVLAYYRCLPLPYPDCKTQYYIDDVLRYVQYLPWAIFSALRVYALSQRSWFLTAFTFYWTILVLPLNYYNDFHHTSFVNDPVLGCTSAATTPYFLSLLGTLFIRGGQIIADAVVIGVTWKATYHARSEGSMSFLTRVMFRNGTTYFIILLGLNILHIVSIFVPTSFLHIPYTHTAYVTKFLEPITAILISHFILDLHETNQAMSRQDDDDDLSGVQVMGTDIGELTSEDSMTEQVEVWAVNLSPWRDIRSM